MTNSRRVGSADAGLGNYVPVVIILTFASLDTSIVVSNMFNLFY